MLSDIGRYKALMCYSIIFPKSALVYSGMTGVAGFPEVLPNLPEIQLVYWEAKAEAIVCKNIR